MLPYSFAMGGNGVNRRTVLAGFAAAGFGLATGACTASAEATEAGTQLWRCVTPAGSITTLVIADSVVCAGIVATYPDLARKVSVYAIDAATGKEAWTQDGGGGLLPFAAGSGMVYCIAGDGLAALSAATGRVLWHSGVGPLNGATGFVYGLYEEETVYTTVGQGVVAVSGQTGKELWLSRTPGAPTALTFAAGTIYTGWQANGAGEVAALDAATGARQWTAEVSTVPGGLAVTGGVVVSTTSLEISLADKLRKFAVSALDASTGRLLWQSANKGTEAIAAGGGVVFTSPEPLAARDVRTGKYLWQQNGSANQPRALSLGGDTLYTCGNGSALRAFSALTGSPLWSYTTPSSTASVMAVGQGVVYVGAFTPTTFKPGEHGPVQKPGQVCAIRT
jgi:outer membrane protein assembly factor BamB